MRFSLTALLRLIVVATLGSSAVAVGLSRLAPASKGWRMPCSVEQWSVNGFLLGPEVKGSVWFDARDGRPVEAPPESGRPLEYASRSPWRDERGRSRAVGRWCLDPDAGAQSSGCGLALMSLPDGEILDRVSTDSLPLGFPCWEPGGTSDRVLFATCDGRLYLHEFGATAGEPGRVGPAKEPAPIRWGIARPGLGEVLLSDPSWVAVPGLGDLVLVSIRSLEPRHDGQGRYSLARLWWLRLGEDRRTIVAAGPLLDEAVASPGRDVRCPSIVSREDGARLLAYLDREAGGGWSLRLARMDVLDRRPVPIARPGALLVRGCQPTPARPSPDGRWLSYVGSTGSGGLLGRVLADPEGAGGLRASR